MSIDRYNVGPRLSQAVRHAGTIYVAGTVADDPTQGAKEQTAQILRKIDGALAHFGSNKSKLLSATIWLANMGHFDEMNQAWDAWVDRNNTPARATVESRLARPGYLVEIAAIASV
jgi:enamine deaminase RidA (YjgF/YER057c/UK114 family)